MKSLKFFWLHHHHHLPPVARLHRCYSNTLNVDDANHEQESSPKTKPNPSEVEKLKRIKHEMMVEKYAGNYFIPDTVPDKHWTNLLEMDSPLERKKFYRSLKKREIGSKLNKEKAARIGLEYRALLEKRKEKCANHIEYGLSKNTLFLKLGSASLTQYCQHNLIHGVLFGQDVVVDFGYEDHMNSDEISHTVYQINCSYAFLKMSREPFHLHFCNLKSDGKMLSKLKLAMPFLQKPCPLITVTEKSYLDLFPKDKIVYLTSHCRNNLKYNHDDVFVIGGLHNRRDVPLSLAKAKKEGLRMARFPLDDYLQ